MVVTNNVSSSLKVRRHNPVNSFPILLLLSILLAPDTHAANPFTPIDVSGAFETVAKGINNSGQIVGYYSDPGLCADTAEPVCPFTHKLHGFLMDHGVLHRYDVPGSASTTLNGINRYGDIVGQAYGTTGGFLLGGLAQGAPVLTRIDNPFIKSPMSVTGLNDIEQMVGTYNTELGDNVPGGFLLYGVARGAPNAAGGTFIKIEVPSSDQTQVNGLNNNGQIVGDYMVPVTGIQHAFIKDINGYHNIDVPGSLPGNFPTASGINDLGQIVGSFTDAAGTHGFLLAGGKSFKIDYPGATETRAGGINNNGQIVGTYVLSQGGESHAFLLTDVTALPLIVPPAQVIDPATFTYTNIQVTGAFQTVANGINDAGQIVGYYSDGSLCAASSCPFTHVHHGFLMNHGLQTYDVPGSSGTVLNGINRYGDTVGSAFGTTNRGFLLGGLAKGAPVLTRIDSPFTTSTMSVYGINDIEHMVGTYSINAISVGFLLLGVGVGAPNAANGNFIPINFAGVVQSSANGINNNEQIVGYYLDNVVGNRHAFLWDANGFRRIDLSPLVKENPFFSESFPQANGINDLGQIVGDYTDSTGTHGFLLDKGTLFKIDYPNAKDTFVKGINNKGQIVGGYLLPDVGSPLPCHHFAGSEDRFCGFLLSK